jgi:hypothetical protein
LLKFNKKQLNIEVEQNDRDNPKPSARKDRIQNNCAQKGEGDSLKEALSQKDECQKGCA